MPDRYRQHGSFVEPGRNVLIADYPLGTRTNGSSMSALICYRQLTPKFREGRDPFGIPEVTRQVRLTNDSIVRLRY